MQSVEAEVELGGVVRVRVRVTFCGTSERDDDGRCVMPSEGTGLNYCEMKDETLNFLTGTYLFHFTIVECQNLNYPGLITTEE